MDQPTPLDRLSALPDSERPEGERVPEGWRVEWQVVLEATDLGICYSDAPVLVPSDTPHEEGADR